eukprot:Clim_evm13s253 gene=Clim_evmTU13s253
MGPNRKDVVQQIVDICSPEDPETAFTQLSEIGRGSFGNVYRALTTAKRPVAIKQISLQNAQSTEEVQEILKELQFVSEHRHRHVVHFEGAYFKLNCLWLVLEFCAGSVQDILEVMKAPLKEWEIATITAATLDALAFLHEKKVIHRDIKAGNILLSQDGGVRLADFGSASLNATANTFIGSPYWMAPEVILAMEAGTYKDTVDIWSMGITCIEMAEKKPPLFEMHAMSALYHIPQNDPPTLRDASAWSPSFTDFLGRCLQKEPGSRRPAAELLNHQFLGQTRGEGSLVELIHASQQKAREIDLEEFKEWKAAHEDGDTISNISATSTEDDLSLSVGSLNIKNSLDELGTPNAGSQASLGIDTVEPHLLSVNGSTNGVEKVGPNGAPPPLPPRRPHRRTKSNLSGFSSLSMHSSPDTPSSPAPSIPRAPEPGMGTVRPQRAIQQTQAMDHLNAFMKMQLKALTRLQKQQQTAMSGLERKHQSALQEGQTKQDKELAELKRTTQNEVNKLTNKQTTEVDKTKRAEQDALESAVRRLKRQQKDTNKEYDLQLNQWYKLEKERRYVSLTPAELRKKASKQQIKDQIKLDMEEKKVNHQQRQQDFIEKEVRSIAISNVQKRHSMELTHLDSTKDLRKGLHNQLVQVQTKHVNTEKSLATTHLLERHDLQMKQHQERAALERRHLQDNQEREKREMAKKHATEKKLRPKRNKRLKEQLKKQAQEALRIQAKQYKALQKQQLETAPKGSEGDLVSSLQTDQNKKALKTMAQYKAQIKQTIAAQDAAKDKQMEDELHDMQVRHVQEESELERLQAGRIKTLMTNQDNQKTFTRNYYEEKLGEVNAKAAVEDSELEEEFQRKRLQIQERSRLEVIDLERNQDALALYHSIK